ncbi:MAG: peptidoglycan-binding domain-containing protein [Terracidiphilus sp.]
MTHRRYRRHERLRGQQAIEPERAAQIQQALIQAHYLSGEPTGKWDSATIAAMQKYQADHGWQTKLMPDSRALENLGLGPDYSDATNARELSLTKPADGTTIPPVQVAGFAAASGVSQ